MASTKAMDRLVRRAGMRLGPAGCGGDANSCYGDTSPDNAFASEKDSARTEGRWIYVQNSVSRGTSREGEDEYNKINSEFEATRARVHPGPAGLDDRETSYYDNGAAPRAQIRWSFPFGTLWLFHKSLFCV